MDPDRQPKKVEARLGGFTANRLHFLGGVAGWGAKSGSAPAELVKATLWYSDGQKESLVFHNGIEFADYIVRFEGMNLLFDFDVCFGIQHHRSEFFRDRGLL